MSSVQKAYHQIVDFARERGAKKVVLFGSRARGDAAEKSDIDIAVEGCADIAALRDDVSERLWSLLKVDLVDLDGPVSSALLDEIARDGMVLYETV